MCRPVRFAFLLVPCLLASCDFVYSRYPLSDEKTSKIDERLIGSWAESKLTEDPNMTIDKIGILFAKAKDSKNTLEMVYVKWEDDKSITVHRSKVFALKLNSHYLSLEDKTKKGERYYHIVRYDMPDNDTLHIYGMDHESLRDARKAGKKIKMKSWSTDNSLNSEEGGNDSLIEEKTENLVKIIKKCPQLFKRKPALIFKRKSALLILKKK